MSGGFASLLKALNISVAVTSYQSGRLYLLSQNPRGGLNVDEQIHKKAMGLSYDGKTLTLATLAHITLMENILRPDQAMDEIFSHCFLPRTVHFTGVLDAHDVGVTGKGEIVFVNTRYNCIAAVSPVHSFKPVWKPEFISKIVAEDRCHLNGLAMQDGDPRYVTAVSKSDTIDGWRDRRSDGGIVMDVVADKDYAASIGNLGQMYVRGLGVPKDNTEALRWYRKSAKRSHPVAFYYLGQMYFRGIGVVKNAEEAMNWYRKSADNGYACAMYVIGYMHVEGNGVKKNETIARAWYRKAAEKGNSRAMINLGIMYAEGQGGDKDFAEALKWVRKAVESGSTYSLGYLGYMYAKGLGVARDDRMAVKFFRRAADKGSPIAKYSIGWRYNKGVGVAKDAREAAKFLLDAYKSNSEEAEDLLLKTPTQLERDTRQAIQISLNNADVYSGSIDGKFGPGTRRALEAFATIPQPPESGQKDAGRTPPAQSAGDRLGDLKDLDKLD